jgi:hypothetical protein
MSWLADLNARFSFDTDSQIILSRRIRQTVLARLPHAAIELIYKDIDGDILAGLIDGKLEI